MTQKKSPSKKAINIDVTQRPTAKQVDAYASDYHAMQQTHSSLGGDVADLKLILVQLCAKWGSVPKGAEKSLALEGNDWTLLASFGASVSIDKAAVGNLQAALARMGRPGLFKKLFLIEANYLVAPGALQAIAATLRGDDRGEIERLLAAAQVSKGKAPSLKAEPKEKGKKTARA